MANECKIWCIIYGYTVHNNQKNNPDSKNFS